MRKYLLWSSRILLALVGLLFIAAAIFVLFTTQKTYEDLYDVIGHFTPIVGMSGFGFCLIYFAVPKRQSIL